MDSLHAVAENDFLSRILRDKRQEVEQRLAAVPADVLFAACQRTAPAMPVRDRMRGATLRVIAEVKRGSPSAGTFGADIDASDQAAKYAEAGAAAISVLTDSPYFGGSLEDLKAARLRVDVPLLRKDFVIDEYQLLEARQSGADIVLLIVAALEATTLRSLLERTERLGMAALVEVNTVYEAGVACEAGASFIGINNRNLRTFEMDMLTTARVRPSIPQSAVVASLSGIRSAEQAIAMREAGADAILVGEALIRSRDPGALIAQMTAIR
jgi:indole-3-glycerol phosphate synthase